MSPHQVLARARSQGARIFLDGDRLVVRAPRGALDVELRQALARCKPEILAILSSDDGGIPRRAVPASRALTPQEAQLWLQRQLHGASAAYHLRIELEAEGEIDDDAVGRALTEVVSRHDVLNSTIHDGGGGPVALPRTAAVTLHRVALDSISGAEQQEAIEELARSRAAAPFDLAREAPMRATLVRQGPRSHVLLLAFHHVAVDGWSLVLIARELGACYAAALEGREAALPRALQMSDYGPWRAPTPMQRAEQVAWWQAELQGLPALDLPLPRPTRADRGGAALPVHLGAELTARIHACAQQAGVTPYVVLMSGWIALLHRLSGQDSFGVGGIAANREHADLRDLVGFLAQPFVVRADLSGDPTFGQVLQRVQARLAETQSHSAVSFAEVAAAMGTRPNGLNPLFEAAFVFEALPPALPPTLGARWRLCMRRPDACLDDTARFDLALVLGPSNDGLRGFIEVSTDRFSPLHLAQVPASFAALLAWLVNAPEQRVSQSDLHTAEQRAAVLALGTGLVEPRTDVTVVDLLRARADQAPDRIALRTAVGALDYGALDRWSDRLAAGLLARGAGPGQRVGLCLPRSPELIASTIAIAKAGATIVPVEAGSPPARLRRALDVAPVTLIITHQEALDGAAAPLVSPAALDSSAHHQDLPPRPGPDDLAYVLFTSGSTGLPKGVGLPHKALLNLVQWQLREDPCLARARVYQFTSPIFDVFFQELYGTLAAGGELVLPDDGAHTDMRALADDLQSGRVDTVYGPQTLLQALALQLDRRGSPQTALRRFVQAGEALRLTPEVLAMLEANPQATLVNHYGPTEAHVVSSEEVRPGTREVSIGRPIDNVRLAVVDRAHRLLPRGLPGELLIAGPCLAQGYVGDSARTEERFLHTDFLGRAYRTGDRVRWREDGALEFLGRVDRQVKVAGVRVEPGEVEAVMAAIPGVAACAVVAIRGEAGVRLAAHFEGDARAEDVIRELRSQLPTAFVPATVDRHLRLPRTATGKVAPQQILSLMDPSAERAPSSAPSTPPATPTEHAVASVWEEVLGVRGVSVDVDFHALGGHSLLAVSVAALLEARTGHRVDLALLGGATTVRAIARALDSRWAGELGGLLTQLSPGSGPPLVLLPPIQGTVDPLRLLGNLIIGPVFAFRAPGLARDEVPCEDIPSLAARYADELLQRFPDGSFRLAGYSFGGSVAHELAIVIERRGREVDELVLLDAPVAGAGQWRPSEEASLRYLAEVLGGTLPRVGESMERCAALCQAAGLVPCADGSGALAPLQAVIQAHQRALEAHRPGTWGGAACLVLADRESSRPGLVEAWAPLVGSLRVTRLAATHHRLLQAPTVDEVARLMQRSQGSGSHI